jgi:hypothetical protein
MALNLISAPRVEPVTLDELKAYLRVDSDDTSQNAVITGLAIAARAWAEVFTRKKFVQQTWRLTSDFFPGYIDTRLSGMWTSPFVSGANALLAGIRYAFELPYGPVQSVSNFKYQDQNGNATSMVLGDDYVTDLLSNPARVMPPYSQIWPAARVVANAVQLDFVCGLATPVTLSISASSATVTGYTFAASDVGLPITIPGAGPNGDSLDTFVASTSAIETPAGTAVTNATALLVNATAGNPAYWELIRSAIRMLTAYWFEKRIADDASIPQSVKSILWPVRDLRF